METGTAAFHRSEQQNRQKEQSQYQGVAFGAHAMRYCSLAMFSRMSVSAWMFLMR